MLILWAMRRPQRSGFNLITTDLLQQILRRRERVTSFRNYLKVSIKWAMDSWVWHKQDDKLLSWSEPLFHICGFSRVHTDGNTLMLSWLNVLCLKTRPCLSLLSAEPTLLFLCRHWVTSQKLTASTSSSLVWCICVSVHFLQTWMTHYAVLLPLGDGYCGCCRTVWLSFGLHDC